MNGFQAGATSQSIDVRIVDDQGLDVTGLAAATFPALSYSLAGPNADGVIVLVDLALITTAWTSGGLKERGEGIYRLDLPNAVLATAGRVTLRAEDTDKRLIVELLDIGPTHQSLSDQIDGTGTGPFAITFTVTDFVSGLQIQNATVTLTRTGETATGLTNVSGIVILYVTAATFTRTVSASGYTTAGAPQTVTIAASVPLTLVAFAITPSDPAQTTAHVTIYTGAHVAVPGAVVELKITRLADGTTGSGISDPLLTGVTNGSGFVEFVGLPRLADYDVRLQPNPQWYTGTTLDAGLSPLAGVLGLAE